MTRFAVGFEYDGTAYSGWQTQRGARSVQQLAEQAFSKVADSPVVLICAGRTDAGVHAREQVAHFDSDALRPMRGWVLGGNSNLPRDISVSWVMPAPAHFHARYSAEARTYRYFIFNRGMRSALVEKRATHIHRALDHELMREGAQALIGEHDFSAFRSSECQAKSPIRRLTRLGVERDGEWICIEVTANAFLHHMVRNIAGLLIAIGQGDRSPTWAREVLEGRDRTRGGVTAPPDGLYLWSVDYPVAFGLPPPRGSAIIAPLFGAPVGRRI
ncbi:MAG: tRNA pseudouridine(38-40) synthase TruA [Gammaproteobacteria bacterium]